MFRIACTSLLCTLISLCAPSALAAGYPEKPIRLLIPFPPGGATDILARGLQDKLEAALGGSNIFMTTELFKYKAKINLTHVPYKGGGPATIGLISGETQVLFVGILGGLPHMKAGRMRGLAVTTKQRSPAVPDMPTIDEAGVPGYDKPGWFGLFAPAKVPGPIVAHVYGAMAKVLKDPATVKRLAVEGAVAVGNPPEEFGAFVRAEISEWSKLIRDMKL